MSAVKRVSKGRELLKKYITFFFTFRKKEGKRKLGGGRTTLDRGKGWVMFGVPVKNEGLELDVDFVSLKTGAWLVMGK